MEAFSLPNYQKRKKLRSSQQHQHFYHTITVQPLYSKRFSNDQWRVYYQLFVNY